MEKVIETDQEKVKEIADKILRYYSSEYNKEDNNDKSIYGKLYMQYYNLSFPQFIRLMEGKYNDLKPTMYSPTELDSYESSIIISVSEEDAYIRIYHNLQTGVIYKLEYAIAKHSPTTYIEYNLDSEEKEIPEVEKIEECKKIANEYNNRIVEGELLTLEDLLSELNNRSDMELSNLEYAIQYRNKKYAFIDAIYKDIISWYSWCNAVGMPTDNEVERLTRDFEYTFGYKPIKDKTKEK